MTVETETIKVTANGNDAATVFSFSPIVITEADDLVVIHVDADGLETTLSEGTGPNAYAVTVAEYPGTGSITYPEDEVTPLPTGESLVITRVLALLQPVDLENQGGYFPDVQEQVFDRGIMIAQQLKEQLDRTVVLPISVTGVDAELPIPEGDKVLGWNTDADALENKTPNTAAYITLPVSATDNGVVRFDGVSGAAIQDSGVTIDDSDNMNVPGTISENGTEVVKETRNVISGAGLTGGGDLSADRTFALDIASQAEAEAGTSNTKGMTPLRTAQAIDGALRSVQVFEATDTWTKPAGLQRVVIHVVGGGGGGGGGVANTGAGGGGGGGYAWKLIGAASLGATETVTVGAAGAGGSAGSNPGNAGGTSSFGAHATATGGGAGAAPGGSGGAGGIGSSGDLNIGGDGGGPGTDLEGQGGGGGSSPLGGGGQGVNDAAGANGRPYGGGGSGAASSSAGGNGAAGVVIVEEYY